MKCLNYMRKMKNKGRLLRLWPLLAALLMSACLAQPHPDKNLFSLDARLEPEQISPQANRRTVLLATVTAASGYDNRSMVYKVGPEQFKVDFYNEFTAPPARLLADQTAQYLDRSNPRLRAVKSPGLVVADYGLETYLEYMYGDFTGPVPMAEMSIRFTFNDLRGTAARVILDRTYRRSAPMRDNSPAALAEALSDCLTAILSDLNHDLRR